MNKKICIAASNKSVKAGDIMFFDWGDGKGISHATIVSKVTSNDIYYAAHSRSRYNYSVKGAYQSKWKIYIISMKTN
ncbi:MAG: amidase domain-containing protein [Eubacterium sp.]